MDDAALIDELKRVYRAHTIILYGSRARGDAIEGSDIDVAVFAERDATVRDARLWCGLYLDGFVYPTDVATIATRADAPDPDLLKLVGGRVLLDERGLAGPLLARLADADRAPPTPATEDHRQMLRVWARKMLARIQRDDVEAHYRRHWLLQQLLDDYFTLRGERYRGPKLALAELAARDTATFAAFERALRPDASLDAIAALVDLVVGSLG